MAEEYNFQYTPLTGRLPGKSFVEQTEKAINELAGIVNEGSAQVEVITNLANQANDNSEEALEKANEALETSSRVYITLPNLDDADDYFDSQLYYFANSYSANLPVQDTGFLEVKTNDTKTAAEQVFVADTTGLMYLRHGNITSTEVGDETVYSVTWETWSSALASENYVQYELTNYIPLSGGTMTGAITTSASDFLKKNTDNSYLRIMGGSSDSTGSAVILYGKDHSSHSGEVILRAKNASYTKDFLLKPDGTLTWNGQNILTASNYNSYALPLSGGTLSNTLKINRQWSMIACNYTNNEGALTFYGGDGDNNGARFRAFGKNANNANGYFQIQAHDGTNGITLEGRPDGALTWNGQPLLPVGIVQAFAGTTIPNGWLLCDGSAVSRTTYANLYACIGDTYGAGDGSTTFNLPNLVDKFIEGSSTAGTEKSAGLPNITGDFDVRPMVTSGGLTGSILLEVNGSFSSSSPSTGLGGLARSSTDGTERQKLSLDASLSSSVYGASTTVQPPALTMRYIIKY